MFPAGDSLTSAVAGFTGRQSSVSCLPEPSCTGGHFMATYLTTIKFTQHGIQDIGQTTRRAAAFKAAAKKLGVKVDDIYWTMGEYDGLLIFDAPDDETATAAVLHLAATGSVH